MQLQRTDLNNNMFVNCISVDYDLRLGYMADRLPDYKLRI